MAMSMKVTGAKREQLLLVAMAFGGIVCLWVYYAYIVKPLAHAIAQQGQQIRDTRVKLQRLQQTIAQEPQLRQEDTRLSETMQNLRTSLPLEAGLPSVIERLSDLASQTSVKIQTIFPQRSVENLSAEASSAGKGPAAAKGSTAGKPPPALYKEIPIQIDALSGFHQLGNFLARVESGPQPMRLRSLRISANPQETRRHTMKIVVIAYFAAVPEAALGAKAETPGGGT